MIHYLPLPHPWAWALGACVVAAVLEGVLSGAQVKQRFAELRLPRAALPLWAWTIIGVAYYLLFFLLLKWLLGSSPTPGWTAAALSLAGALLGANAAWNWVFFQKKDLWLGLVFFGPYLLTAVALAGVLFRIDSPLAPWLLLYVGYLLYAAWWIYSLWRLNPPPQHATQPPANESRPF